MPSTIKLNKYEHDLVCPELRSMAPMMSRHQFGQILANYREHLLQGIEELMDKKELCFEEYPITLLTLKIEELRK